MDVKGMKRYWVEMIYQNKITSRPKEFPNSKLLVRIVAKEAGGITIVKASDVSAKDGVTILKIDGIAPGEKGYALVSRAGSMIGGEEGNVLRRVEARFETAALKLPTDTVPAEAGAEPEAEADGTDDETERRLDQMESDLLDMQIAMLGGGSEEDPFAAGPLLELKGFGHVTFYNDSSDIPEDETSAFALGGLDLFIISQLSEKLSFLNETVFEPTADGEYILDVERVILKYSVSDALSIAGGRFHTTLGHWNEAFHHGEWLQTSIGRPAVLRFEDDGGLLPMHMIGVSLKGGVDAGESNLDWTIEVGNGRGVEPDPPQITVDANDAKAVNLSLGFQPASISGLRVGGGAYMDSIPGGAGHAKIAELILSGFAVYRTPHFELMAEYFDVSHDEQGGVNSRSAGYYAQLSYSMDEWTPYLRYDVSDLADSDTFFAMTDDTQTIAGGLRYDFEAWSAVKLQYGLTNTDPSGGGAGIDSSNLALQVSFAF